MRNDQEAVNFAWLKSMPAHVAEYLAGRPVREVECNFADMVGMARGKTMPGRKFKPDEHLSLATSPFYQTVSGGWAELDEIENQWVDEDIILIPDLNTAKAMPWASEPAIQVICDIQTRDGAPMELSPRNILKRVLSQYEERGWRTVVAPELEFYLAEPNVDPRDEICPPLGRSKRETLGSLPYSQSRVREYRPVIDTIYEFARVQGLPIDSVSQEDGVGQLELNLLHGDALQLADQVFYLKQTIREAAFAHNLYATFMAKPMHGKAGSAMHLHQSVVEVETGKNIFTDENGEDNDLFRHFIGGSQKYLPKCLPMIAPYANSYRRLNVEGDWAPANVEWATDNRTTGLRVPHSGPEARRLENRLIGMDCNPYLAIAASLACGLLGIINKVESTEATELEIETVEEPLPLSPSAALREFSATTELQDIFGAHFCMVFAGIKHTENQEFLAEIAPWDRQHLMLTV